MKNMELSKTENDCKLISKALSLIADVNFWAIGNNTKAFEYYELSIKEAEKCNDKETLLKIYEASENPYFNTQQYYKSRELLLKKEKIDPKLKDDYWHIASFGDLYRNMKSLDSADLFYKKAVTLAEKQKDSTSILQLYYNYALIPNNRGDYRTAIKYCKKGLLIAEKINFKNGISNGDRQISDIYRNAGDWSNAKKHLIRVVKEAELFNRELSLIKRIPRGFASGWGGGNK